LPSSQNAASQTEELASPGSSRRSPLSDSGFSKDVDYDFLKAPPTLGGSTRSRKTSGTSQQGTLPCEAMAPRTDKRAPVAADLQSLTEDQQGNNEAVTTSFAQPQTPISAGANKRSLYAQPSLPMKPSGPPLASPSLSKEWSQSVFAVPAIPTSSRPSRDSELAISRQTSHASMRSRENADLGGPTGSSSKYYSTSRAGPSYGSIRQSRDSVRSRADVVVPASPASHSANQLRMASVGSERSSEYGLPPPPTVPRQQGFMGASASTEPTVVQDLTKTMIGQFLWKDTRKAFSSGLSGNAHERFFWINPYTKTLYWSATDPGGISAAESSAKSGK
jgi:hypothetical protein